MMKIVFLDRDGVINEFPGYGKYVTRVKDFTLLPGAREAIRRLTELGYEIVVVSNQAGVGSGVYSRDKLNRITRRMLTAVRTSGGRIRRVMYCTHRADAGCDCRKPRTGSIFRAIKLLKKSRRHITAGYFVGDTERDVQAGKNAGLKTIFVLSGGCSRRDMRAWQAIPDYVTKDLRGAVRIIENENTGHSRFRRGGAHKSR